MICFEFKYRFVFFGDKLFSRLRKKFSLYIEYILYNNKKLLVINILKYWIVNKLIE